MLDERYFGAKGTFRVRHTVSQCLTPGSVNLARNYIHGYFTALKPTPLSFYFTAYQGTSLREAARADWSGTLWSIAPTAWDPGVIPEPTSLLLLGSGLFGAGVAASRRRKRSQHRIGTQASI